ncbi:SDR family NAD(P)-dependent oxidoreductase [Inquilinus sp.]|uniref:SDR family NAD(P)-dependent oxidoreductase n=1 Tax=Inquilinus sp. TaxID=1932117 RepID=UPI00378377EB
MSKLTGKIAVITGGSSGIGRATARRFVEEGAHVFIVGRRQVELDATKAEIGHGVSTIQADVANLDDLDRVFTQIKAEKGSLDILVASAGLVEHQPITAATPEHYDRTFDLNARGAYFTVAKALPIFNAGGAIVLVSSGMHLKGFPQYGVYAATKAALRSFARTWAAELKDRRIRVNTLSPGMIDTPIVDGMFSSKEEADAARQAFAEMAPLGRIGEPDEIASGILFLASNESSYTTGFDLVADGGITQL